MRCFVCSYLAQASFSQNPSLSFMFFEWFLDLLVVLDIIYNFTLPYLDQGVLVTDPHKKRMHYLKVKRAVSLREFPVHDLLRLFFSSYLYVDRFWEDPRVIQKSLFPSLRCLLLFLVFFSLSGLVPH